MRVTTLIALALASVACRSAPLPAEPPRLVNMAEPLELAGEPADEDQRQALPSGSFTGLYVTDARRSLDAMLGEPEGLAVERVVENSPADALGLEAGDLLLATVVAGEERELGWPSDWRAFELELEPGSTFELIFDRAGVEKSVHLASEARVRPAEREDAQRLREEDRVGIVVRAATEVEARAAGLGPGAGAVVVGLSSGSPWREAGLRFEDLILAVDGASVAHPQVLLDAIQGAARGDALELEVLRDGVSMRVSGKVSRRDPQLSHVDLPLLFSYERERGQREYSFLLGALRWRRTAASWDLRLLWLFSMGGGDSDRLQQVSH